MNERSPHVVGIFIYTIKSLDGVAVNQATILKSGALKGDREFAIVDEQNKFVNGKRTAKIHQIRSIYERESATLFLQVKDTPSRHKFQVEQERPLLETWLGNYFGFPVKWVQNTVTGFPDDYDASGLTIISTGTIQQVASWFDLSVSEMRLRLRANIEISGVPPFWEDRLFAQEGYVVQFQIGNVLFQGTNPCQRCIVPARNSLTGEVYPNFQKIFTEKRKNTLPEWATSSRFNHFYRLSVNTRIAASEEGKILQVGDEVKILEIQP